MGMIASLVTIVAAAVAPSAAQAVLPTGFTATKVGWNVVGLDSNRVTVGPNQYPNGVYMCNTSGSTISGSSVWTWLDNTYASNIYLADDSTATSNSVSWTIPTGSCQSVYWTVEIARLTSSYFKTRDFKITVNTTSPSSTTDVVTNQQIYVEKLVSQNRNIVGTLTGPGIAPDTTPLYVGGEYTYSVSGATAPGGYEQLEFAAVFDPRFFEILEVSQNYAANTAPASRVPNPNYQLYADGCGWNNTTRACTSTGKVGGNMTSTYKVRIIGAGSSKLNTLIYDFSGSSYHYNADFGAGPTITTQAARLSVTKTVNDDTYSASSQLRTFTITATNVGDDTLQSLRIDDTTTRSGFASTSFRLADDSCTPTLTGLQLAPGAATTCTVPYRTTANDVSARSFTNTAVVTGARVGAPSQTITGSAAVTLRYVEPTPTSGVQVIKTASPTTFSTAGQTITFTIVMKNLDNPAKSLTLTDSLSPLTWSGAGCPPSGSNVSTGGSLTCTATYTTTSADVNAGRLTNVATLTATGGGSYRDDDTVIVTGPTPPALAFTKTPSPATYTSVDDTIRYTFVVTNTGDDTLTNVSISDPLLIAPPVCGKTTLAGGVNPDDSTTCFGTLKVSQAQLNDDTITNTATVTAINKSGSLVSKTATATVTGPAANPQLSITKSTTSSYFTGTGDIVPWSFLVTNTGNVTVNNITVTDDTVTNPPGITCSTRSLVPGASTTCVARYTATAADKARTSIPNRASVTGTPARGTTPTATSNLITVPYSYSEITVTKVARDDTVAGLGSDVTFDIRVINTGNLNLTDVTVDDTIFRSAGLDTRVPVTCGRSLPTSLNVDDSFTCTANYTFTQADVDLGFVNNTVLATGDDTTANIVDDSAVARVLGPVRSPGLTIEKVALTDSFSAVDDTVNYQYTLRNTGNVTLTNVYVDDSKVVPQPIPCISRTLAPGQSTTCEAYYLIRAADMNSQWLENTASATATPPSGTVLPPVTPSSAYVLKVNPPPLRLTKTVSDDTFAAAGQTRTYYVTAWNAGGSGTLTDLTISDALFDDTVPPISPFGTLSCFSNASYTTPTDDTTLLAGEYIYCRGTYTITQADMNAGYVNNTATAIALDSNGQAKIARDTVTITGPTNVTTGISVTKTATPTLFTQAGQNITFSFVVTNTGTVTLSNVQVLDGTLNAPPTCVTTTLAPSESTTCTGTYTTTAADVSAGSIVNVASATGTPSRGTQPTASATKIVPKATPATSVTKTQDDSVYTGANQPINYTVVVTNTGDDTLTSVTLDDTVTRTGGSALARSTTCSPVSLPGTLNPGQATSCTAAYTTTAGESTTGGTVTNTATARATPASGGGPITDDDSVTARYRSAGISVTKTQDDSVYTGANQPIN